MPLLDVRNLSVRFRGDDEVVRAVDRVSFHVDEGETLALVGESGSGKSTAALALMGLVPTPPGEVDADAILLAGLDLARLPRREMRKVRGARIAMVFQDPGTSLNPLLAIGTQLVEALQVHRGLSRREARTFAVAALHDVGIASPEERLAAFPHQLSGGMRQRVMIAMALLLRPKVLICDEPTTALDVTIQAQVLELLAEMQRRHGTAILLITHSLGVVAGIADRVAVMYAGRVVEDAETRALFARPMHPYTAGLIGSAVRLRAIPGAPPDPAHLPLGCAFAPRCGRVRPVCRTSDPALEEVLTGRRSACLFANEEPGA